MARVSAQTTTTGSVLGAGDRPLEPATRAPAQTRNWIPSLALQGTLTNNVDLVPTDRRQGDFITQITPAVTVNEVGTHTRFVGSLAVPILLYARTGSENNYVYPNANLFGDVNFLDRRVHVEGAVNVSQQFFSPFGAQPGDLSNATDNRYRSTTYRVSPYVQGTFGDGVAYELRNNNTWTNLNGAPTSTANSHVTEFLARANTSGDRRVGWSTSYHYTDTEFTGQSESITTQLARVTPYYGISPQLRLEVSGGYENNRYQLSSSSGAIYGVGFRWRPTDRTDVVGAWEHRFFGSSYLFTFDHRTRLTVWNVRVSRNITTYPQQVASLAAGANVESYLDRLFLSAYPDAAQRQQFVEQFMSDRGLPGTLIDPVTLYTEQITLQQLQSATIGLIGARNSIFFNVYNLRSQPISAAGTPLPPSLFSQNSNTQTGGSVVWTRRLTSAVNLTSKFSLLRTEANAPLTGETNQGSATVALSMPISGRTTGFVGARYQALSSDFRSSYNETAAFLGIVYTLR